MKVDRAAGGEEWTAAGEPPGELDEALLRRAQRGDAAASCALIEVYQRPVFRLLHRMLGPGQQRRVEDLTQETFLHVFRSLAGFAPLGPARLSTWILTIATRRALEALRRDPGAAADHPGHAAPRPASLAAQAGDPARQTAPAAHLSSALASLPPEQRAAFLLRAEHRLTVAEVARALELDRGAIASRLAETRIALRRALRDRPDARPAMLARPGDEGDRTARGGDPVKARPAIPARRGDEGDRTAREGDPVEAPVAGPAPGGDERDWLALDEPLAPDEVAREELDALAAWPVPDPPAGFADRVLAARAASGPAPTRSAPPAWRRVWPWAAVALAALLAPLLAQSRAPTSGPTRGPAEALTAPPLAQASRDQLLHRDAVQRAEIAFLRARVRELEQRPGGAPAAAAPAPSDQPGRPWFDPGAEELARLARECRVRADMPALLRRDTYSFGPRHPAAAMLAPDQLAEANRVVAELQREVVAELRALYAEATGDDARAAELAPQAMAAELAARSPAGEDSRINQLIAAERAGLPAPPAAGPTSPLERLRRRLAGLGDETERRLAAAIGETRARALRAAQAGWEERSEASGCPE
jgi:RNA polymerase sigma-70 factor (ECF subfamily)